jgi:hypothetical protein
MRAFSALERESTPIEGRIQSVYKTDLGAQPCINDPLLPEKARGMQMIANAHDFEPFYPFEFDLLKHPSEERGYQSEQGSTPFTRFNGDKLTQNFHTNKEVEDFIYYLENEFFKCLRDAYNR